MATDLEILQKIQALSPTQRGQLRALFTAQATVAPEADKPSLLSQFGENFFPTIGQGLSDAASFVGRGASRVAQAASPQRSSPINTAGLGLIQDVGGAALGLGRAASGLAGAQRGENFADPNQQLAAGIVDEEVQQLTDPQKIADNPFRFLQSVAAFAPGGSTLKVPGIAKTAKVIQNLDPTVAALTTAGLVGKGVARVGIPAVNKVGAIGLGLSTGKGFAAADALVDVGAKGGEGLDVARRAIKEETDILDLGKQVEERGQSTIGDLAQRKAEFIERTSAQQIAEGNPVRVRQLKDRLLGDVNQEGAGGLLNELKVKVLLDAEGDIQVGRNRITLDFPAKRFTERDKTKINNTVEDFLNGPDNTTVEIVDDFKKSLDNLKLEDGRGSHAIGEFRKLVRAKLSETTGFDEVSDPIKEFRDKFDEKGGLDERLGTVILDDARSQTAIGEKLVNAFRDGTPQKVRLKALNDLGELFPDLNIKSQAAGLAFQGFTPSGLIGRGAFVGGLGLGAGIGVGALAGITGSAAMALAFIPRFAGQALIRAGQAQSGAQKLQRLSQQAVIQLASLGVNPRNMTLAQVLARNEELFNQNDTQQAPPQSSFLGNVGRATQGRP